MEDKYKVLESFGFAGLSHLVYSGALSYLEKASFLDYLIEPKQIATSVGFGVVYFTVSNIIKGTEKANKL